MRAGNPLGYGNWSEQQTQIAFGLSGPAVSLRASAIFSMQIDLSWQTPADTGNYQQNNNLIFKYVIEYATNSSFTAVLNTIVAPNNCTGVMVCTSYYSVRSSDLLRNGQSPLPIWTLLFFRVYAVTQAGAGNFSDTVSVMPIIPALQSPSVQVFGSNLTGALNSSIKIQLKIFTPLCVHCQIAIDGLGTFGTDGAFLSGNGIVGLDGSVALIRPKDIQGASMAGWNGSISQVTAADIHVDGNGLVSNEGSGILYFRRSGITEAPSGSMLSLVISNVTNPHQSGLFYFDLWTLDANGNFTLDQASNVSGSVVVAGFLSNTSMLVSNPLVGALTVVTLSFVLSARNSMPRNSSIEIIFGSYLNLGSDPNAIQVYTIAGMDGALAVDLTGGRFVVHRTGGNDIVHGTDISIGIQGTNTMFVIGGVSAIVIRMLSLSSAVIDQSAGGLHVNVVPFFVTSQIQQSTPVALALNTISVSFSFSVNMTDPCSVTISGLSGYPGLHSAQTISLIQSTTNNLERSVLCNSNQIRNSADLISGSLILTLCQGQSLSSNTLLSFAFTVTNPSLNTAPNDILISASGNPSVSAIKMTSPAGSLLGIPDGHRPLRVVVPAFSTFIALQSTPIASAVNTITVTLGCQNIQCGAGTTLTISGISSTGTKTKPNPALGLSGSGRATFTGASCDFDPEGGNLKLTVATGQMIGIASNVTFTITVVNSDSEAQAPNLTLSGAGNTSNFGLNATSFSLLSNFLPMSSLLGILDGSKPFRVAVPLFLDSRIAQSSPLAANSNLITVTFSTNVDCPFGSSFTVSGLVGSASLSSSTLPLVLYNCSWFDVSKCLEIRQNTPSDFQNASIFDYVGVFNSAQGTLVLTIADGKILSALTKVIFSFVLQNPASDNQASVISLTAGNVGIFGQNSQTFSGCEMTPPEGYLLGVVNGYMPLQTVIPGFVLGFAEQSTPVASAMNNVITVSFATNIICTAGSVLTISGLNSSGTKTQRSYLELGGNNASFFLAQKGDFDPSGTGTLKLTVIKQFFGGFLISFNFNLINADSDSASWPLFLSGTSSEPFNLNWPVQNSFVSFQLITPSICTGFPFQHISTCTQGFINRIHYNNNENFVWTIAPLAVTSITLWFTEFSTDFAFDVVTVLSCIDQECTRNVQLGSFSGDVLPERQVSDTGIMQIRWRTDKMYTAHGWSAMWDSSGYNQIKAPLFGVLDGRKPMRIILPKLGPFFIMQSTPITSAQNILNITLGCQNIECAEGTIITISGITYASTLTRANKQLQLSGLDHRYFVGGCGDFDPTTLTGTLKLTIARGQVILSGSSVTFSIVMRNVAASRELQQLTASASGNNTVFGTGAAGYPSYTNECPSGLLLGVTNGYCPFVLMKPQIKAAKIMQTIPFKGQNNTIVIRINMNVDLLTGSRIIISGIKSSCLNTERRLILLGGTSSRIFGSYGKLDTYEGTLEMSITDPFERVQANSDIVLTFNVTNNVNFCDSLPDISITAIGSSFGFGADNFEPVLMLSPEGSLYGVKNGYKPFLTVVPMLDAAILGQTTTLPFGSNTVTVTIKANVDCPAGSSLAISGLPATGQNSSDLVTLNGTAAYVFGGSGYYDTVHGILTLSIDEGELLEAHQESIFSFEIVHNISQTHVCSFELCCWCP